MKLPRGVEQLLTSIAAGALARWVRYLLFY